MTFNRYIIPRKPVNHRYETMTVELLFIVSFEDLTD